MSRPAGSDDSPEAAEARALQAILRRGHARLVREGVGWYKDGVFEASRCALPERSLPAVSRPFWERQAAPLLWQALNEIAPALYEDNAWAQRVLGLDAERLAYLRRFRAPGQPLFEYFGVDSVRPAAGIVDVNSRPGVLGYIDEIRAAHAGGADRAAPGCSFNEALFERLRTYTRARPGRALAVILPERGVRFGDKKRIVEVARRHVPNTVALRLSELHQLPARAHPALAFLTMIPADIFEQREKFAGLLALAERGVPVINPPESYLAASKTMMHLLAWSPAVERDLLARLDRDPARARAKRALLRALLVPSVLVHDGVVHAGDGRHDAARYLAAARRKRWVLKPGHTSGGWGVEHGAHCTRARWEALAARAAAGGTWVLEEAQEHERHTLWAVVSSAQEARDVGADGGVDVRRLRARLLYRSYAVRGSARMFQEMFAARGWKVNAAGWSIPAGCDGAGEAPRQPAPPRAQRA